MDVLPIVATIVVGLILTFAGAGAGYWFGGRRERARRRDSLVDARLHDVGLAVAHLEQESANVTVVLTESREGFPAEQRTQTARRISEDFSASASVTARGMHAAIALGADHLVTTTREFMELLTAYIAETHNAELRVALSGKLIDLRAAYEDLRTKLV